MNLSSAAVIDDERTVTTGKVYVLGAVNQPGSTPHILAPGRWTLGSGPQADLRVNVPGIEARHCEICVEPERVRVRSFSRMTWVNDRPVHESTLRIGDRLIAGPLVFELHEISAERMNGLKPVQRVQESVATSPVQAIAAVATEAAPQSIEAAANETQEEEEVAQRNPEPAVATPAFSEGARDFRSAASEAVRQTEMERASQWLKKLEEMEEIRRELERARTGHQTSEAEFESHKQRLFERLKEVDAQRQALADREIQVRRRELQADSQSEELQRRDRELTGQSADVLRMKGEWEAKIALVVREEERLSAAHRDQQLAEERLREATSEQQRREQAVVERNEQLERLQQTLREREQRLEIGQVAFDGKRREFEAQAETRERELMRQQAELAVHTARLAEREAEIKVRDAACSERWLLLEQERREFADRLRSQQDQRSEQQERIASDFEQRERQVISREAELIRREREFEERRTAAERELESWSSRTAWERTEFDRNKSELDELRRTLDERSAALHAGEVALQQQDEALRSRLTIADEDAAFLNAAKERVSALETELASNKREFEVREQELGRREREVEVREFAAGQERGRLQNSEQSLESRWSELTQRETALAEQREGFVAERIAFLAAKQSTSEAASVKQQDVETNSGAMTADVREWSGELCVRGELAGLQIARAEVAEERNRLATEREALEAERQAVEQLRQERTTLMEAGASPSQAAEELQKSHEAVRADVADVLSEETERHWAAIEAERTRLADWQNELQAIESETDGLRSELAQLSADQARAEGEWGAERDRWEQERAEWEAERSRFEQERQEFANREQNTPAEPVATATETSDAPGGEHIPTAEEILENEVESLHLRQLRAELEHEKSSIAIEKKVLTTEREQLEELSAKLQQLRESLVAEREQMNAERSELDELACQLASHLTAQGMPITPVVSTHAASAEESHRSELENVEIPRHVSSVEPPPVPAVEPAIETPVAVSEQSEISAPDAETKQTAGEEWPASLAGLMKNSVTDGEEEAGTEQISQPGEVVSESVQEMAENEAVLGNFAKEAPAEAEDARVLELRSAFAELLNISGPSETAATTADEAPSEEVAPVEAVYTEEMTSNQEEEVSTPEPAPVAQAAAAETHGDDDVSNYMQKLLARYGGSTTDQSRPSTPNKPEPKETPEKAQQEPPAPKPTIDPNQPMVQIPEPPPPPKVQPDREAIRGEISSFREVANLSARSAVAKSSAKRMREQLGTKSAILAGAVFLTTVLVTNGVWGDGDLVKWGWISSAGTAFAGFELWRTHRRIRHLETLCPGLFNADGSGRADDNAEEEFKEDGIESPVGILGDGDSMSVTETIPTKGVQGNDERAAAVAEEETVKVRMIPAQAE